jgi:hypothetical protein
MTTLANVWINPDGLAVKFGAEEGAVGKVASFEDMVGSLQHMIVHFDYTDIPSLANVVSTTVANGILDYTTVVPKGSRIHQVKLWAETAMVGVNATLDVGFVQMDYVTELDYNGLVAAAPTTVLEDAGAQLVLVEDSTYAGALIGTTLTTQDGIFTVNYNTAAFTAGKIILEVSYYVTMTT